MQVVAALRVTVERRVSVDKSTDCQSPTGFLWLVCRLHTRTFGCVFIWEKSKPVEVIFGRLLAQV